MSPAISPQGTGRLWWIALEMVIAKATSVEAEIGGAAVRLDTSTTIAKQAAFDRLHDWLRGLPGEHDVQREISALCVRHGVDEAAISRELCMSWDELKPFADDPLITIGAHTITHCNLAKQTEATASHEMATGRARIESVLQRPVAPSRLSLWRQDAPPAPVNSRWRAPPASRPR